MTTATASLTRVSVADPSVLPITLIEAKEFCRIEHGDDDGLINALIRQALGLVEGPDAVYGLALLTQTWDLVLDAFPGRDWSGRETRNYYGGHEPIEIPLAPVQSVTSVTSIDADGAAQIWATSKYTVDLKRYPALVFPAYRESYPATRDVPGAVTVRFVAGYGNAPDAIPEPIRGALRRAVLHFYDHRDAAELPDDVHRALLPYRLSWGF